MTTPIHPSAARRPRPSDDSEARRRSGRTVSGRTRPRAAGRWGRGVRTGRGPGLRPGPKTSPFHLSPPQLMSGSFGAAALCQPAAHAGRHPSECFRLRGRGTRDDDRLTGVAPTRVSRSMGIEARTGTSNSWPSLAAALSEDRRSVTAVRAREPRHVLDDPQDGHVHLPEHLEALPDVQEGHVLGVVTMIAPDRGRVWDSES